MIKNLIFASLITAGFANTAQAQTVSKSFDVDRVGASATLVGLGNVTVDKSGQFNIGPGEAWSLTTGKLSQSNWNLAVQYLGAGRDGLTLGNSEFGVDGNVINVEFDNSILKYERRGSQIEQIIVVKKSPAGKGNLSVAFSMSERFSYKLQKDGGFTVNHLEKTLLKFGSLTTIDATGKILPSRIQIKKNIVSYVVEDEGAVYPVTIDPLVSTPTLTVEGTNNGQFAFAFDSLDINNDGFQDLIVGEDRYGNGEMFEGRIYLFLGSAAGLSATSAWQLESDEPTARFGSKVRNLGDINNDGNEDFAIATAYSSKAGNFFGNVAVFLGDETAPGTPIWDISGTTGIEIIGSDISAGDFNCDGVVDIAIGSNFYNNNGGMKNGRVQIFNGTDVAPYFSTTNSFAISFVSGSEGGTSLVAANINGDVGPTTNKACMDLVVGRPRSNVAGRQAGGFDVFLGAEAGPSTTPSSLHEGLGALERTGFSLATADFNKDGFDDIVVGAYLTDNATDPNNIISKAGRISVHNGSALGLEALPAVNIFGTQADIGLGYSLVLGDFDNNSFIDIAAGAPNKPASEGLAFVYLNAIGSPSPTHGWTASNGGVDGRFGDAMTSGDFNNDGFSDLVVGAVEFSTDQGSFYVYEGQAICTIGDAVYLSGDVSADGCGICDTAKSTTDWSALPRGTECGTATCSGEGLQVSACDGNLQCVKIPTLDDCGAFTCDARTDKCFEVCANSDQCEMGAKCENKVCISPKPIAVVTGPAAGACSDTISLSGKDSTDPSEAVLTYAWTQTGTPDVLAGVDVASQDLVFVAPVVTADTILTFSLVVKSAIFESDPIAHEVTIAGCPDAGDMADMGTTSDMGGTGIGPDATTPDSGTDLGEDSTNGGGELSGGGCGCMSSEKANPAGSILLIFILGFLVLRRKKRS